MAALNASYGDLAQPDFREIYAALESPAYRRVASELQAEGFDVIETTDLNDDVAAHLIASRDGDKLGLALSGIGKFAALRHQRDEERSDWVTHSETAPTALAALVARVVEQAGFKLLGRGIVTQRVAMNRADGTTEATLYQALFTDSGVIP